ncbi:thiol reductant ABC exporter subunit CydD [Amorphus sp. 3PC139-8]|uniref:thiol reductant ABC exporter subunit CydD n=1 Tax=Amorphus sp. 3PC139-8 TaxID=2735676 RepID=UPI00345D9BB3
MAAPGAPSPETRAVRIAGGLQIAAALGWLPQAALIAAAIGAIGSEDAIRTGLLCALGVLVLGLLRAGLDAAGTRLAFRAARSALSRERAIAVTALAGRSPLDTDRPASGAAASALAEQAEALVPYLSRFQPARLKATVVPLVILACVAPISWLAAAILVVAGPLIPVFMALIGWQAQAASEAQLEKLGDMNGFLLDRLRGMQTIRAFDAVDQTAKRLRADAESLRTRTMEVLRIAFLSSAVLELFSALGVALVAVFVGFHLLGSIPFGAWGGKLDLAHALFVLLVSPTFFEPLRELSAVWHDRAAGEAAKTALANISAEGLPLPGAHDAEAEPAPATATSGAAVEVNGLTFSHAGRADPVFEALDLTVAPGERIALYGSSGIGKSTLLALIAGLAPIPDGAIRIDGVPLDDTTAATLRRRMAWIGQRPHVFVGTLRQNVALHRPGLDRTAIDRALGLAALGDLAELRPDTIGEGGVGLSGGEVVRLSIARAVATPGVNLLLADEPTAHLDTATADRIAADLFAIAERRTLIVATHDPRIANRADRVIRFADKKLTEAVA